MNLAPIRFAICCPCSNVTSRGRLASTASVLFPRSIVGSPGLQCSSRTGTHEVRISSNESALVTSYTRTIPLTPWEYDEAIRRKRCCPETSQSWTLRALSSSSNAIVFTTKSTPAAYVCGGECVGHFGPIQTQTPQLQCCLSKRPKGRTTHIHNGKGNRLNLAAIPPVN
eukprot:m.103143 g.103143  ORF g.103143 m.103143 type:complete len:169 (+) comp12566_c0_seq1:3520-4026(+)